MTVLAQPVSVESVSSSTPMKIESNPPVPSKRESYTNSLSNSSLNSSRSSLEVSSSNGCVGSTSPTSRSTETSNCMEALPASSAFFATSESKARLLTRLSQDNSSAVDLSGTELNQKKEELVTRLSRKLEILREEQDALTEERRLNEELGEAVCTRVGKVARPGQSSKLRLHVSEVGHITSLLLGLSGRLARAENALLALPLHHHERVSLESKRDKLLSQLMEAKQLKTSIDQRSESVMKSLSTCLSPSDLDDYQHFISMKAKLIVDARELADKISLGEEQLDALRETLS